jgi:hypothetical protein
MLGSPSLTIANCKQMTSRLTLILALVTALAVAGCGSAATETSAPASSGSDVNALLKDTFQNAKDIKSADVEMKLSANGQGQTVSATLGGPYESLGTGKLPKFQWNASLNSGGKSFTGGVTWTGDKGYVTVQGTSYELSGLIADQFKAGYEQALKENQGKSSSGSSAALLGIDFSKWLTNAKNAGDAQAGGVDAIEITGDADVAQVIDDLQKVSEKASSLKLPGTQQVPSQLTAQERQQILGAVKKLSVQVYTGKADKLLRRIVVSADIVDPSTKSDATATFDFTLNKVNQAQSIQAPANPKPFSDLSKLADQLKGSLGSLGALAGGSASGSSSGSGGSATAPSSANIDKYAKCIEQAGGDTSKAQKCADLLTG